MYLSFGGRHKHINYTVGLLFYGGSCIKYSNSERATQDYPDYLGFASLNVFWACYNDKICKISRTLRNKTFVLLVYEAKRRKQNAYLNRIVNFYL